MQAVFEVALKYKQKQKNFVKTDKKAWQILLSMLVYKSCLMNGSFREDNRNLKSFLRNLKKVLDKLNKMC